jgi:hypothetical protein
MFCGERSSSLLFELACHDFEDLSTEVWMPGDPDHWAVTESDGSRVYELTDPGIQGEIRAPTSWSLIKDHDVTSFEITGRLKCTADPSNINRDLCVFFHFQDPAHFYYVHFSAQSDALHNIIGIVNGKDRVKINREPAGESTFRLIDQKWHDFKVTFDASTGEINAFMDDMEHPILTAQDKTLSHGLVGIGSFDDTGCFDDICLKGMTWVK